MIDVHPGGVTSSSLEVLAGLALSTQEYMDLMIFKDGKPSEFYQSYVRDIQQIITENASLEAGSDHGGKVVRSSRPSRCDRTAARG